MTKEADTFRGRRLAITVTTDGIFLPTIPLLIVKAN
jgi:hypothetical protein